MTTEQAFLADICSNPDDDGVRLIYADWLAERDGPGDSEQAEFIRVQIAQGSLADQECCQCQAARHGGQHTNGPCRCSLAWRQLRQREKRLLASVWQRVQNAWYLWQSPGIRDWWQNADFRRGFVEHVTLKAADWCRYAERLRVAQPIREVTLTTSLDAAVRVRCHPLRLDWREVFLAGEAQPFATACDVDWIDTDRLPGGPPRLRARLALLWPGIVFHGPDFPEGSV
jgi:uncharacterized protein (TIGR02996 family)